MMPFEQTRVLAQDLIRVIFEDMDLVWLHSMWETRGSAHGNMIEILISLALLKFMSRLWFVNPFENDVDVLLFWGCISFPNDSLMTSTFDDDLWYYDNVVLYLWYLLCDVLINVSKFHSLSKIFCCSFLVTMRKVNSWKSCSVRGKAEMTHHRINY